MKCMIITGDKAEYHAKVLHCQEVIIEEGETLLQYSQKMHQERDVLVLFIKGALTDERYLETGLNHAVKNVLERKIQKTNYKELDLLMYLFSTDQISTLQESYLPKGLDGQNNHFQDISVLFLFNDHDCENHDAIVDHFCNRFLVKDVYEPKGGITKPCLYEIARQASFSLEMQLESRTR